jgi:hypothetical protein
MMSNKASVAIVREDGGVSIMKILRSDSGSSVAIAEEVEKWQSTSGVKAAGFWSIADSEIPQDRTFRDAWASEGKAIAVNMDKARLLHMGRIRTSRDEQLKALDVPFMRAVEGGDVARQSEIARLKQSLRDIPAVFDLSAASNAEDLNALWPESLPRLRVHP